MGCIVYTSSYYQLTKENPYFYAATNTVHLNKQVYSRIQYLREICIFHEGTFVHEYKFPIHQPKRRHMYIMTWRYNLLIK